MHPVCRRCDSGLRYPGEGDNHLSAAIAASALLLYLPAVTLPLLSIERLGHSHQDSLWSATVSLLASGNWWIGVIILIFSLLLPPLKLAALWLMSVHPPTDRGHRRAMAYHLIEWLGRWGMLDVLLVALLVAMVKLGDLVSVRPGPGLAAFTAMVLLSLIAGMSFDPTRMWRQQ